MRVTLLHNTPLWVCARAIRTCRNSHNKSDTNIKIEECGTKDKDLIYNIGNKNKHSSVLEHLVYNFEIEGISRGCLQELVRHRIASYSVKSTRYVLTKELKNESVITAKNADKYIVLTGDDDIDSKSIQALENLRQIVKINKSNDKLKYALPECFKTTLVMTINARSLQNFLYLRTSNSALWEIKELAFKIYDSIPDSHKYLFSNFLNNNERSKDDKEKRDI